MMTSKYDSKGEQSFFEVTGAVKADCKMFAVDQKGKRYGHLPDAVYYDERVKGVVFVNFKDGNFPETVGARGGVDAAEADKDRYLQQDWGNKFKRMQLARATKGWNHSMYQPKTFVETWEEFFPNNRVYYLIVCRGITRQVVRNKKVAERVQKFKGFGEQFAVMDVPEFQQWVGNPNVEHVDFDCLERVKDGRYQSFGIHEFPVERGVDSLKTRFEVPPALYYWYTDDECPFVCYEKDFVNP
ncbi:hypothetical protein [Vibrio crassostreae]|uniref:hypothetical protein n=1 Tax=Vibrio crassostreae TaxID=246167 RepID=UPI00104A8BB9|nr:hypothetical protein [Vibrio crassostreae]TCT78873.1 hypothetical protein EDB46_101443 [Vibrio crassostreae]CAK1879408.1 hypothetical protein VCRA2110O135_200064 [Vibrio crassostreae]CAK2439715.1 hypothetical protein VCRA2111O136_10086 [Vibrio crassostreae]CAK2824042.1 hypothetical protein VCRA217O134_10449 [Vibrio crassostreae]